MSKYIQQLKRICAIVLVGALLINQPVVWLPKASAALTDTNISVITSGDATWEIEGTSIASNELFDNRETKTSTVKLTNTSGKTAQLSFAYEATISQGRDSVYGSYSVVYYLQSGSNAITDADGSNLSGEEDTLQINGSFAQELENGGSAEITISSVPRGSAKIVLSDIKLTVKQSGSVTFMPDVKHSYTVNGIGSDGTAVSVEVSDEPVELENVQISSGFTITCGTEGYQCVEASYTDAEGENGKLQLDNNNKIYPNAGSVVSPVFVYGDDSAKPFRVGSSYYWTWDAAFEAAGTSRPVILNSDYTLPAGTYNMASGSKLVIPYDSSDGGTFGTKPVTSEATPGGSQSAFRTLSLADGVTINCSGMINVNGRVYGKIGAGRCTDTYGCIRLNEGAKINMNSGSTMYCYGYIIGDGEVIANDESTVYEVFQMTGWSGGGDAYGWATGGNIKSFLFNDYAIQNIEANYVVKYGATAAVSAAVTVDKGDWFGGVETNYVATTYIGDDIGTEPGLIQLEPEASVRRSFTPATNRVKHTFFGDVNVAAINMNIDAGITTVPLNSANYILAINHYMDFVAAEGSKVTLLHNYMVVPGATLTVVEGAEATLSSEGSIYIYDTADYMAIYGGNKTVSYIASLDGTAGVPKMTAGTPSGKITVNGTLTVNGSMFATENGGSSVDKVLYGSGTLINKSTATANSAVLDYVTYEDAFIGNEASTHKVPCVPVVGQLTGISTESTYNSFDAETYTGLGNGWWYQNTVTFSGDLSELKAYNGSVISINGNTATGYSCTGGTLQFTLPFTYTATCSGATMTSAAAPGSAVMAYSVPVAADGVTITVTEGSAQNNATIKYVSKGDGKVVSSQACYIPVGTDVRAYFSDEACTKNATTFSSGDTLYMLVEARVGEDAYYAAVGDAVSNAANGETVTLIADVEVTSPVKVSAEQDIVIDLAGKTLTYSSNAMNVYGAVTLNMNGGTIINAQGAEVSALVVRNGGELNLDMDGGKIIWSAGETAIAEPGTTFSNTAPFAPLHNGGTVHVDMTNGGTIAVDHNGTVTTANLHAIYNTGTMTVDGQGVVTTSAYTSNTGTWVNYSGSNSYAVPAIVNQGTMTLSDGVEISAAENSPAGRMNFTILNSAGGDLTLNGVSVTCPVGYVLYNWGATISSIKDTTLSGSNGICNFNMVGFGQNATIEEVVGSTTIITTSGSAFSTHPETYVGVLGGAGSDVQIISKGNAINNVQGTFGELADGLTLVSVSGDAVYNQGVVELVSGGYYYGGNLFVNKQATDGIEPSITVKEGYQVSVAGEARTLRNGSTYLCVYLTTEAQDYPAILAGHLQVLPESFCAGTNLYEVLTPQFGYFNQNGWTTYGNVYSITIPVTGGDQFWASSFGATLDADGKTQNGVRITWIRADGTLNSVGQGNVYGKAYLTSPDDAVAVCIPVWDGAADGNAAYLITNGHNYEYLDADGDGRYTARCTACQEEHATMGDHLQFPKDYCGGTNLWNDGGLRIDAEYPDASQNWIKDHPSVTIPVEPGDKLWISSAQDKASNSQMDGIRVTWFLKNGSYYTRTPAQIFGDRDADGCVTTPSGAFAVCVAMWTKDPNKVLKVTNKPHIFTEYHSNGDATVDADGTETAVCAGGCGTTDTRPDEGSSALMRALQGKVISIMGDSISTYEGWIPGGDDFNLKHRTRYPDSNNQLTVDETWWYKLIFERLSAKLGINESWAGSRVLNTSDSNSGDVGPDAAMASNTRIINMGSNGTPDLILFYGGTNDIGAPVKLGEFDPANAPEPTEVDLEKTKWDSLAEAYVTALLRMKYYYPGAQIIAMLPTYTMSYYTEDELETYNAVLAEICEHYEVPYVDLRYSGFEKSYDYLSKDGIHPTAKGMEVIEAAILKTILDNVTMEDGEHIVYEVTHSLTGVKASHSYYQGISAGKPFEETLTGEEMEVTVTMGNQVVTDAYDPETGKIYIEAVTGDLEIQAAGKVRLDQLYFEHIKDFNREEFCCGTNLWDKLGSEDEYFANGDWAKTAPSLTIPVQPDDQIWATSFQKAGVDGNSSSGIRVTWFLNNGKAKEWVPSDVDSFFSADGYLTAPDNAVAVCVPMWPTTTNRAVKVLNLVHSFDESTEEDLGDGTVSVKCKYCDATQVRPIASFLEGYIQSIPEGICGGTDLWATGMLDYKLGYYDASGSNLAIAEYNPNLWSTKNGQVHSVTIPISSGDRLWGTSFGAATGNGSSQNGIRVTWFYMENGKAMYESWAPGTVYSKFTDKNNENGENYIEAPTDKDVVAVNVSMWNGNESNVLKIISKEHDYVSEVTKPTCTENGYTTYTCAICDSIYQGDVVPAAGHDFSKYIHNGDGSFTADCNHGCGTEETVVMASDLYENHLQIPEQVCPKLNLWEELQPVNEYYYKGTDGLYDSSANAWGTATVPNAHSITIPISQGDRIWAKSFQIKGTNGGGSNGIRVAWFLADGKVDTWGPGEVYTEFSKGEYLTAPAGAIAVCIPMWNNAEDNAVYILNSEHSYETVVTPPTCSEGGKTTYTCTICGDTYKEDGSEELGHSYTSYTYDVATKAFTAVCDNGCGETSTYTATGKLAENLQALPDKFCSGTDLWHTLDPKEGYYKGSSWGTLSYTKNGVTHNVYSITIPVNPGDRIWATSFQKYGDNNNYYDGQNGIRVTWFKADGTIASQGGAATYEQFLKNGECLVVPEGVVAFNIPMWSNVYPDENHVFILSQEHDYDEVVTQPTCTEDGFTTYTCSLCRDSYVDDYVDALGHLYGEDGLCVRGCGASHISGGGSGGSGDDEIGQEIAQIVGKRAYATLEDAINACSADDYILMLTASTAVTTINKSVLIDLNGLAVSNVTVTAENVRFMDSTANSYDAPRGTLTVVNGADKINLVSSYDNGTTIKHYVKIVNDGSIQFYRAGVSLTALQYVVGASSTDDYLIFHGTFRGNSEVAAALHHVGFHFNDVADAWFATEGAAQTTQDFAYARKIGDVNTAQAMLNFGDSTKKTDIAVSLMRENLAALLATVKTAKEAE